MADANKGFQDEPNENNDDHIRKRRRTVRKGTHSCWACRRRKEKCLYEDGGICAGCLRPGTKCVSQRFADNETLQSSAATATATRLQRIEEIVAQLASQIKSQSHIQEQFHGKSVGSLIPSPTNPTTQPVTSAPATTKSLVTSLSDFPGSISLQALSKTLHESLPCPQDIQLLRKASQRRPILSTIHITKSYKTLHSGGIPATYGVLLEPPSITSGPILVARYMFQLAISLQEMQSNMYPELACLTEPATILTERCAEAAMSLVTRQDNLLGSIESLEAVVLESLYQCNSGRLRLSWMAVRRAMVLAQSLGLHLARGDDNHSRDTLHYLESNGTRVELAHLWFRIVHYDLQLSRMLGFPPGELDAIKMENASSLSSYNMTGETPEGYLEQVYRHVMVLTLEQRSSDRTSPDAKVTQTLVQELQKAASSIPSQWWLPPNLIESSKSPDKLFWDM